MTLWGALKCMSVDKGQAMDNRRTYTRQPLEATVELTHPGIGLMTVQALNISDGGIAVSMGRHVVPPVGTVLQVRIKRHSGALNDNPVAMRVVHIQPNGIVGLMFC
ncbi:MAG: PilZ domain-containing protein [Gammaproteobacteria bacterium]|nr:MAG: PilZ domain-containing protein [Gammaproteobacteria bacterium]